MIFSKTTGYGIRSLAYLANQPKDRICGLQEISAHEHIPSAYLRKVLGELRRHRFLRSVKGIHGGYELARPANTITLWEVFTLLEPDPYWDMCILSHGKCNAGYPCGLHSEWQNVRTDLIRLLETRTIADIAASPPSIEADVGKAI
jgi:Rrf2 family protein